MILKFRYSPKAFDCLLLNLLTTNKRKKWIGCGITRFHLSQTSENKRITINEKYFSFWETIFSLSQRYVMDLLILNIFLVFLIIQDTNIISCADYKTLYANISNNGVNNNPYKLYFAVNGKEKVTAEIGNFNIAYNKDLVRVNFKNKVITSVHAM